MIQNISIEKLRPHPNNPRKDLGDLTELADSIKANGVFQNLTVVPNDDDTYTIIIGHRRTAAAKLAGLTELPCAIVEMSEKDQLGTMLLENIQRSELTVYEQAQGFQMMIDLGETVETIHEKTGFGKSTIYKRVKLCQLDEEKFKKGQERGATLEDYAKLDKITDPELKNRALDSIGTVNFDNAVRTAVADEKYNKELAKWETLLSVFATRKASIKYGEYEYVKRVYMSDSAYNEFKVPDDADKIDYYYVVGCNSWDRDCIEIYKEKTESSLEIANKQAEQQREQADIDNRKHKLKELAVNFQKDRKNFIKNYVPLKEHSNNKDVLTFVMSIYIQLSNSDDFRPTQDEQEMSILFELLDYEYSDSDEACSFTEYMQEQKEVGTLFITNPIKFILALLYVGFDVRFYGRESYFDTWDYYAYHRNLNLEKEKYLNTLKYLGYQMSDEERSLYDGTHELYMAEEDEEFLDEDDIPDFEEDE